ncbi:hypothetical protein CGLO_17350 [Colletotrichum gloeosporioides Cg-14]|uniref:Uncharacterized protein n=1 Tax=Colletotrichum gloeosporioides (strain Cg-14) TaxID=1237896 RepID=T0JLC2_COLGC|nr:hypothetical protein CGLO_17350 [Colletotrichum gloeosporioides Cg-14]
MGTECKDIKSFHFSHIGG